MKKVANSFCRIVLALTAAIFMFSFMKTETHAANDTIVIDFSKGRTYSLTSKEMPEMSIDESHKLSQAGKDCFFLYIFSEFPGPEDFAFFKTKNDLTIKYNAILNQDPLQTLNVELVSKYVPEEKEDSTLKIDSGSSSGTYELTINEDLIKSYPNKKSLFSDLMSLAYHAYGINAVDANGKPYLNVKFIFKNPNSTRLPEMMKSALQVLQVKAQSP